MAVLQILRLVLLLSTLPLPQASAVLSTAPAFIWSNDRSVGIPSSGLVDYRVLSPVGLTDALMQKLGSSNLLCSADGDEDNVDIILAFIGNQVRSQDLSSDREAGPTVLPVLKEVFSSSQYSMAFPYITLERPGTASALLSTIKTSCHPKPIDAKITITESCFGHLLDTRLSASDDGIQVMKTIEDAKEFIKNKETSRTLVIVACHSSGIALEEGDMLTTMLSSLHNSQMSYVVLYSSNPFEIDTFHGRLLVSNVSSSNSSSNSTCDVYCQTIASAYGGAIVAVTLLIILISGLCCMMGIETPKRFESFLES